MAPAEQTDFVVVPRPRRGRDCVGRRVRTIGPLRNGYAEIPAGRLAVVIGYGPKGLDLRFEPCGCCGVAIVMTAATAAHVEFIEEQYVLPLFATHTGSLQVSSGGVA